MSTNNETKHTPLPWTHSIGQNTIWANDGTRKIANTDHGGLREWAEDEANATFIVRACNSHDELVAAMEDSIHILELDLEQAKKLAHIAPGAVANKTEHLAKARAALAKAKGGAA